MMTNKELVERYPFIKPHYMFSDEEIEDYDYSYTLLDDIPDGWKRAFGIQLCEDLKTALNGRTDWRIEQIKEKFGALRIYANYETQEISDVIDKYEALSAKTCWKCGAPATKYSTGWILPWCDNCREEGQHYVSIEGGAQ